MPFITSILLYSLLFYSYLLSLSPFRQAVQKQKHKMQISRRNNRREDFNDPSFSGDKSAGLLGLSQKAVSSRSAPFQPSIEDALRYEGGDEAASRAAALMCALCVRQGRVNCAHISARTAAGLRVPRRMMRNIKTTTATRTPAIQIYSCPGRHAYQAGDFLGGRAISTRVRACPPEARQNLQGMCPQCWSEVVNDGFQGGRRKWTQGMATTSPKPARRSTARVMERRRQLSAMVEDEQLDADVDSAYGSDSDDDGNNGGTPLVLKAKAAAVKKLKGTKTERRRWKLSRAQEDKLRLGLQVATARL